MNGTELRKAFLDFFQSNGHTIVPSSALVPQNDPTLLFTNAGMNQFKNCFLGSEKRAYSRATTCQKVMRISGKHNDFENVGVTARHQTFFEMLGNFSFGDYFKTDAIKFAWKLSTEVLKVPKDRIWVTIFENDDEAGELWAKLTDIDPKRIVKRGEADNFWSMGETGPCGPCTEMYYYLGTDVSKQSLADFNKDDGTYLEFWNLVFMQFDRSADGKLNPLPKPSVDTGMGFERMLGILQGKKSNYDTDVVRPIIARCEELSGFTYDGTSYTQLDLRTNLEYARDVAMRVIADHSRSATFLIADGVHPGSDGRGYVLRRLIRRAVRHARVLKFNQPFFQQTADCVISTMGDHYAELRDRRDVILKVVDAEERKFHETLDAGLIILQREVEKLPKNALFPGETAFLLHDTYGFPLDLTQDALKPYQRQVDTQAFDQAMSGQKTRSREDRKSQGITFKSINLSGPKSKFLGYDTLTAESKITALNISSTDSKRAQIVLEATPFYAESGGQVGDSGIISLKDLKLRVLDTQKVQDGYFVHECEVLAGDLSEKLIGQNAVLEVDASRRNLIRTNHSATHLVHSALRKVLGAHVKQAGSRVDDSTLRFDYSHFEPVDDDQLNAIQAFVNSEIRNNYPVSTKVLDIEAAKKTGAVALFGEKYGEVVRVVEIGPNSLEFCGGTHVSRSGDIGLAIVASETGVSAGVRRIECWAGTGAFNQLQSERAELEKIASLLKSDRANLAEKIEKLLQRIKILEREVDSAKARMASASSGDFLSQVRTSPSGIKVVTQRIEGADADTLKSMVDALRVKLGSGAVALGAASGDSAIIVAGATPDLTKKLNIGNLIKEINKLSGGRGGGRPDFAQAGGVNPDKLAASLEEFFNLIP